MAPVRPFCVITVLLLVVLAVLPAQAQDGASLNGLDEFVNKAIRNREVPGLAIAIVKTTTKSQSEVRGKAAARNLPPRQVQQKCRRQIHRD